MRFTGKEEDIEVGLQYFGARYYSPNLGRFVSADPLAIHAIGSDLNPYAYVGGRVFNATDPFGLQCTGSMGKEQCGGASSTGSGGTGISIGIDIDLGEFFRGIFGGGRGGVHVAPPPSAPPPPPHYATTGGVLNPATPPPAISFSGPLVDEAYVDHEIPLGTARQFVAGFWNTAIQSLPLPPGPGSWAINYALNRYALMNAGDDSWASVAGTAGYFGVTAAVGGLAALGESADARVIGAFAAETEAANAANAARLRTQLTAEEIAGGHAYDKHVTKGGEFPGITTRQQFSNLIENIINNASNIKVLSNGRTAYWDSTSGTVVIRHPSAVDGGTAFKPIQGKTYFDNLK